MTNFVKASWKLTSCGDKPGRTASVTARPPMVKEHQHSMQMVNQASNGKFRKDGSKIRQG